MPSSCLTLLDPMYAIVLPSVNFEISVEKLDFVLAMPNHFVRFRLLSMVVFCGEMTTTYSDKGPKADVRICQSDTL